MGAAAAWVLAGRGHRVVVLDRFGEGHVNGSSHGAVRVYRQGYDESDYIALARRALPLWRRLEEESGRALLTMTGVVDHGPAAEIEPVVQAFRANDVPHEVLDPDRAAARWPGMRFDERVVHHADGGRVAAQPTVDALLGRARSLGATVRTGTPVDRVEPDGTGVVAGLTYGEVVRADVAVVTAGAWTGGLLDGVVDLPPLQVSAEQPMHFRPLTGRDEDWIPFVQRGPEGVYGLGDPGSGVKVAEHYRDEWLDPDDRPYDADPDATARLCDYVRRWLPGLHPEPVGMTRCLYTTTPDKDFIVDRSGPVVVGAGFSGHGFKFAPAIGELLADLAEGATQPIERFRLGHDRTLRAGVK